MEIIQEILINESKMSLKLDFSCSYCSKILSSPIHLPCFCDSICDEHLKESSVLKSKLIKCKTCHQEFDLHNTEFKSNAKFKSLINKEIYLSDEEKSLKKFLKDSIQNFFKIQEKLEQNKNDSMLVGHNHFLEIRRKIDLQREELKEEIDKISLAMIDQVKGMEALYVSQFENSLPRIDFGTLENEIENLNNKFREVNLPIDSIKQILLEREQSISKLNSKLERINKIKETLIQSNTFKPNLAFEKESFGHLDLVKYLDDPFKSQILSFTQSLELIQLCEFSSEQKWRLIYRGSQHGFKAKDFHENCDGKADTLTLIRSSGCSNIFGGYTYVTWDSISKNKADVDAFIFSLTNKDNQSYKIKVNDSNKAIYCNSNWGPVYGGSINPAGNRIIRGDIRVTDNCNLNEESASFLSDNYKHPKYLYGTIEAASFLAGSPKFKVDEIEVYQKE